MPVDKARHAFATAVAGRKPNQASSSVVSAQVAGASPGFNDIDREAGFISVHSIAKRLLRGSEFSPEPFDLFLDRPRVGRLGQGVKFLQRAGLVA
jgi:hypothetical protein